MSLSASSLPSLPATPLERKLRGLVRPRPARRQSQLRWTFWSISIGLLLYVLFRGVGQSPYTQIGTIFIVGSALLPTYLWLSRNIAGLPIFPLYALTSIWAYGLPLISKHPGVILFSDSFKFVVALSLTGFHLIGTLTWYLVERQPRRPVARCWMFDERNKDHLLIVVLSATTFTNLALSAGWVDAGVSIFSIVRAVLLATEAFACYVLSYRLGTGLLAPALRLAFYGLLGTTLLVNLTSLLLLNVMSLLGLSLFAYTVASRKLPWRLGVASLLLLAFLHNGKGAMRERYWHQEEVSIKPAQYAGFLAEWVIASWRVMIEANEDDQPESLAQRASLMHLLLYFQQMTPDTLPYLQGESYKAVPPQFIPRIFYPNKPRSHEGTYIVSVYYGLLTQEDTDTTTIDIGLINEAYANFGFAGMAGLAVVLGSFFGAASRWARHTPVFSFRTLFAVTILADIFQGSSSASFYVASLYQNVVVLCIFALLVMRPMNINRSGGHV